MEKKIKQMNAWLGNLEAGYGIFGSLDELKKEIPSMNDEDLLRKFEDSSFLHSYLRDAERLEYYQDISANDKEANNRMQQDNEYFRILEDEVKKRNLV